MRLFGDEIKELSLAETVSRVGFVFQDADSQLFSPTVEDEVAFGPENLCLPREEIGKRISAALKAVGMEELRFSRVQELSGGQKQLTALASVLAMRPKALIFDEPMSMLDGESRRLVLDAVRAQKEQKKAVLIVEHDVEALSLADRTYVMENGGVREASL